MDNDRIKTLSRRYGIKRTLSLSVGGTESSTAGSSRLRLLQDEEEDSGPSEHDAGCYSVVRNSYQDGAPLVGQLLGDCVKTDVTGEATGFFNPVTICLKVTSAIERNEVAYPSPAMILRNGTAETLFNYIPAETIPSVEDTGTHLCANTTISGQYLCYAVTK